MSDITEILQPLLILGKYTLLFYKTSSESLTVTFYFFSFLKLIVFTLFAYSYLKVLFIFFIWPLNSSTLATQITLLTTTVYVIVTFIISTKNNIKFNKLLKKTSKLDKKLKLSSKYHKQLRVWIIKSFIVMILVYGTLMFDKIMSTKPKMRYALNYPAETVVQGVISIIVENTNVIVVVVLVKMIHIRLVQINQQLLSISKEINRDVILVKLRWLRPLHMRVTELIQMFNDIFGVNLLAMNAMFFAQFVLLGSTLIDYFGKTVFPIGFIVIKLAYLVLFSGYVWIICHVCHQTEQEVIIYVIK